MPDFNLVVAGRFDNDGGRPSSYADNLFYSFPGKIINGGSLDALEQAYQLTKSAQLVIWMPEIDNDVPKFVNGIKFHNPTACLVISKNNRSGKYSTLDLLSRALQAKANLLLEITDSNGMVPYAVSILDPLGNIFLEKETVIPRVAEVLGERLVQLMSITRMRSEEKKLDPGPITVDQAAFLQIAAGYANKFHECVHAVYQDRFLGNLSFRCESGFPSLRAPGGFWVSPRNSDKRQLTPASMVYVADRKSSDPSDAKLFYDARGTGQKPSVDAPIQQILYRKYPMVQYMMHGHVYLKDTSLMTSAVIPCGALEETWEISELLSKQALSPALCHAKINLRGHGFLVMGSRPEDFVNLEFVPRPLPEKQDVYSAWNGC